MPSPLPSTIAVLAAACLTSACAGSQGASSGELNGLKALAVDPSLLQDEPEGASLRDLGTVILLLGLPCSRVIRSETQADSAQLASCQDGNRYRLSLNPQGRYVAQKL